MMEQEKKVEVLAEALEWIIKIAWANYEEDTTLRSRGARTLYRIASRAEDALDEIGGGSN